MRHAASVVSLGLAGVGVAAAAWTVGVIAYGTAIVASGGRFREAFDAVFWLTFLYVLAVPTIYFPVLFFMAKYVRPSPMGLCLRIFASAGAGVIPSVVLFGLGPQAWLFWPLYGTAGAALAVGHWLLLQWLDGRPS
jgi:hypothetical protein